MTKIARVAGHKMNPATRVESPAKSRPEPAAKMPGGWLGNGPEAPEAPMDGFVGVLDGVPPRAQSRGYGDMSWR